MNPFLKKIIVDGGRIVYRAIKRAYDKEASVWKYNRQQTERENMMRVGALATSRQVMTKQEATSILNLDKEANTKDVEKAYLKLSELNSTEKGGSPYIKQKIDAAKEVLTHG